MRGSLFCLMAIAGLGLPWTLVGQTPETKQSVTDEKILEAAKVPSDAAALVKFIKSRTLAQDERERVDVMIAQLGSSAFKTREQATQSLIAKGSAVLAVLRQALQHTDLEVRRRAELCIQKIKENERFPEVPGAVIRLIGQRKPDGAVPALLAYLPFTEGDDLADEVRDVLVKLAVNGGQVDKSLVAALTDKEAIRRASAGEVLVRAGTLEKNKKAIHALLADNNATVRWRVANALVTANDKDAVPVLIGVLPDVPPLQAWAIEEVLYQLANGKSPPAVPPSAEEGARKKCQDAWLAWWKDHGAGVDMTVLGNPKRPLGFTTVILLDINKIVELYPNDTVRWQIEGLEKPLDVQVLDKGRVLIAEFDGNRVTERNFKGEILWQQAVPEPQTAQRLPNGNTYIGNRYHLQEFDPKGKRVFEYSAPAQGIMKSMKLPDGDILCLFEEGRVVRMDSTGKQLSAFRVEFGVPLYGGRLYATPSGNVLIPFYNYNKVVEYDMTGKVLWQVKIEQPIAATRLADGNTLVTSMSQNRAVEFDRDGREVWQYRQTTRVTRALRR